jgi:hypothetical protein
MERVEGTREGLDVDGKGARSKCEGLEVNGKGGR